MLGDEVPVEQTRPYTTFFSVAVCVKAETQAEAEDRAVTWGMDNLSETVVLTPGVAVLDECEPGLLPVSLTGSLNFIGPSQQAVDEKVRDTLEAVRRADPSFFVKMGDYRLLPLPPEDHDKTAAAITTV